MGCPVRVDIGKNLVFSVTTHDPDTGVLTDADAVPAYRVYENEVAVPILTGNMAKLDDAGTTGFYTETIACTAANGFEDGKTYTVYVTATVDGDEGGICYAFEAVTPGLDVWAYATRTLTSSAVSTAATVSGDSITVIKATTWTIAITGLGSLAGRTKLWFTVKHKVSDLDSAAMLQVEETDGLVYVRAAAGTAGNASLTVDDAVAGNVTIVVVAAETDDFAVMSNLYYDIKMLATTVTQLTEGRFNISDVVTLAIT